MPKETPPPPPPRKYDLDLLAGSELNTLVLATVRVLRGKATRADLWGAVPYPSHAAVGRAIQRLLDYGILDIGKDGVYFAHALWLQELERLYDAYLRLRPDLRSQIRARAEIKRERQETWAEQNLFGHDVQARVPETLQFRAR